MNLVNLWNLLLTLPFFVVTPPAPPPQPSSNGRIAGQVRLMGPPPGNPVIRFGVDPVCSRVNAGSRVIQAIVVTGADGGLANAFVRLKGNIPSPPAPATPVVVDQRSCLYTPRVVGARVGQPLEVRNSDMALHNVHSYSSGRNAFNVAQPLAGMSYRVELKDEEILRLRCDIHRWMTAYVGVVNHPYFAVSGADGRFVVEHVPPGTYEIESWHERYGTITQTIRVRGGATTTAAFGYTGKEPSPVSDK